MSELNLVEIYRAKNLPQAMLLQTALEEAGIRSTLANAVLDGAPGDLALGWPTAPRIMVDSPDEAKAREIALQFDQAEIERAEASEHDDDTSKCLECGKLMPAGTSVCQDCGWSYRTNDAEPVTTAAKEA
jgi:hypothetical protein